MVPNKLIIQRFFPIVVSLLLAAILTFSALAAPRTTPFQNKYIYNVAEMQINAAGDVVADGLTRRHTTSGVPDLPFFSEIIPLPDGMQPVVSVVESGVTHRSVASVRPVVEMVVAERSAQSLMTEGYQTVYQPDQDVYGADQFFPSQQFTSEQIIIDGQPHLRISMFPIRYNPVTGVLQHAAQLEVHIELTPTRDTWNGVDELSICCDLPLNPKTARTQLPVGATAIKIEVDQEGIYTLPQADLAALEPTFAGANPNLFAMLTNGESVAFEVIGGGDNSFDAGDSIRFYGWPYDGPRVDQQFIDNNVFWLWVNGSGNVISTAANPTGYAQQTSFRSEITFEQDLGYTDTGTNRWSLYDNEPDAWYWEQWTKSSGAGDVVRTKSIDVPNPVSSGADAVLTTELLAAGDNAQTFEVGLIGSSAVGSRTYPAVGNYNITTNIPAADLIDGANTVAITDTSTAGSNMYFNRLTIEYDRDLVAVNDELIFGRTDVAQSEFNVSGFTSGSAVAWNITDRLNPVAIPADVSGVGSFSYRIASDHGADAQFIAAAESALHTPLAMSAYDVIELTPAGGADWVAVTHPDFLTAINTLAAHRASYSSITTHVVNVDDVVNQYGYGLPTPNGIRDYIAHAVTDWGIAPRYLLLGGDASNNPRERACNFCYGNFEIDATYVPTFLPFSDRFIGQQPSDHPYALLTGSDELADIAVGRLTVETLSEANIVINKIMQYETNLLTPQPYMQEVVFMVDDDDPGAAIYCADSIAIGNSLDGSLKPRYKCLPDGGDSAKAALRTEVLNHINMTGTAILNYRGHGSAVDWAGGVLSRDHAPFFANTNEPFVIITADCLDGHFAWYNLDTIGETYLRRANVASAAHWSASGLGFSFEYNVLHEGFYDGLFDNGYTAIGDAIAHAKRGYASTGFDPVTGFSMNLQGDPAMQVMRPNLEVTIDVAEDEVNIGDSLDLLLTVTNTGQYPTKPLLTIAVPAEFSYAGISSTTAHTVSVTSGSRSAATDTVIVGFGEGLGNEESAEFTLTVNVVGGAATTPTIAIEAIGPGLEITVGDETDQTSVSILAIPTAVQLTEFATLHDPILRLVAAMLLLLAATYWVGWCRVTMPLNKQ